jgi:hypothetical protein
MRGGSRSSRYAGRDAVDAAASGWSKGLEGASPERGRFPPVEGRPDFGEALRRPDLRLTTTLCDAAGAEIRPTDIASRVGPSRVLPARCLAP